MSKVIDAAKKAGVINDTVAAELHSYLDSHTVSTMRGTIGGDVYDGQKIVALYEKAREFDLL